MPENKNETNGKSIIKDLLRLLMVIIGLATTAFVLKIVL